MWVQNLPRLEMIIPKNEGERLEIEKEEEGMQELRENLRGFVKNPHELGFKNEVLSFSLDRDLSRSSENDRNFKN